MQSGTQPGARIRFHGLGVPSLRTGRRADLVIEIDVQVPTNLNPEQADLLAQLAQLRGEQVTPPARGTVLAHPISLPSVTPPSSRVGGRRRTRPRTRSSTSLDDSVEITGADGHHLQRVRRLRVGEHVTAADGAGGWRRYEIDAVEPGRLHLVGAR